MDQKRLEAFVRLAQELNFTRAAQLLNMTQSTLSASIKSLEDDLTVTLFDRSTRSVTLTNHGRIFLPHARNAIDAMNTARSAVHPAGGLKGNLTIGLLNGLRMIDIPALSGEFHRRHPEVQLRLEPARRGTDELLERLKDGIVDAAFVGTNVLDRRIRVIPIRTYHLKLVVPSEHPLSASSSVTMAQIAEEQFVDMPLGFGQRTVIDDAFAQRALARSVQTEVADLRAIPDFVGHGLGVALLPPELVAVGRKDVRIISLADADLTWDLSVVVKAAEITSRAVSAFLNLIPEHTSSKYAF